MGSRQQYTGSCRDAQAQPIVENWLRLAGRNVWRLASASGAGCAMGGTRVSKGNAPELEMPQEAGVGFLGVLTMGAVKRQADALAGGLHGTGVVRPEYRAGRRGFH